MANTSYFIDWLSASQDHSEGCPKFGADYVVHTDPDTGQVTREHVVGFQHPGSHSTSLRVRSDGSRVEISGNPSRYGREDNLFGFDNIDECFDVYNSVLAECGLPPFSKGKVMMRQRSQEDNGSFGKTTVHAINGARISRVDLTANYATGKKRTRLLLRAVSAGSIRGKRWVVRNDDFIDRGSRDYLLTTVYDKGVEMKRHGNSKGGESRYRSVLRRWCDRCGVVRFEVKLGRKKLLEETLNCWASFDMDRAQGIARNYDTITTCGVNMDSFSEISAILIGNGVSPVNAGRAQNAAYGWLAGADLRSQFNSKSAFYRLASQLDLAGLNVRVPCDVSSIPIRVRQVEVRTLNPPSWYRPPVARPAPARAA